MRNSALLAYLQAQQPITKLMLDKVSVEQYGAEATACRQVP
jgi:hypothetical protein